MPKTWRVLEVTQSPTKFGIRMKDTDDPPHTTDLPATFDTEEDALTAISLWKEGKIEKKEKK